MALLFWIRLLVAAVLILLVAVILDIKAHLATYMPPPEPVVKAQITLGKRKPSTQSLRLKGGDGLDLIYLIHIHKAGGTSFCHFVRQLGLRTANQYSSWGNCMLNCKEFGHLQMLSNWSAASKVVQRYDFIGNEGPAIYLQAKDVGRRIKYFTVLREPCLRTISHYIQDCPIFQPDPRYPPYFCKSNRCEAERQHCKGSINGSFEQWFTSRTVFGYGIYCKLQPWFKKSLQTLDNFQLRALCGADCAIVPFDGITEDHYVYTLRLMEASGVEAVTIEQLYRSPDIWQAVITFLGHPTLVGKRLPTVGVRKKKVVEELGVKEMHECSPQVHAWLAWDKKLYDRVWKKWEERR
eukprot:TRINITY_DN27183_c0_g1_i1.p1 TRINITY_DN27183_c0_g1~~TRINITY_DN27183_c0_g1_i1.p1  ORF type:complete len:351 (-),score=43.62 TRINITY_DN27183_c0_g1_i1:81-1133(-)